MKQLRNRLTAWLLVLGMVCSMCIGVGAADSYWWEDYVNSPMEDWSIAEGTVTSTGEYVLLTSDTHRYTYLATDLLAAANAAIEDDGGTGNVGLVAFGGDFANEKLIYDDNMSILKAALATSEGTVATYTKGNHEGNVSDADFEAAVGMSRIGETAVNEDENYYFFNFGAYNGTTQFLAEDITALDNYLNGHTDKPVFIVSHYPIHYYNDRRSSVNADKITAMLNEHPNAIFLWGHNHTEQDPNYGMIRLPGDIIQTGASADTSVEINFTYACLGALRDGVNGASGLLAKVDGTEVTFRYIDLHNTTNGDTWTDAQGNENPVRVAGEPTISSTTVVDTAADAAVITLANIQIDRPLVDKVPDTSAAEYSPKFTAGDVSWSATTAMSTVFDFNTEYTASFTLTAEAGYSFDTDAVVSVNKEYAGPMPGQKNNPATVTVAQNGATAQVTYTFPATTAAGEPKDSATSLVNGGVYVLSAMEANMAASYVYDPAQHGEETMPDYTAASSDIVIRSGQLVSEVTPYMSFTAQKNADGYLLYSDASLLANNGATTLNYLSMSSRGGELGLEAAEATTYARCNDWQLSEEGVPFIDVDGTNCYAAYASGKFTFVTDPAESNVRLFYVGTSDSKTIYNGNVDLPIPAAGEAPVTTAEDEYFGYDINYIEWDAGETFDYSTQYTVTATLTAKSGYTFAENFTGNISGYAATVTTLSSTEAKVTYTYDATEATAGLTCAVDTAKVDTITSGKQYVLVSEGMAMTFNYADGIYLAAAPVTTANGKITSDITADMIFTLEGDDTDGYTFMNDGRYLVAAGSPDNWGFTETDTKANGMTFSYADGVVTKVSAGSTGAPAGGGPPPGGTASLMYVANGHFHYGTLTSDTVELYEVTVPFVDVEDAAYYKNPVDWAVLSGITNGIDKTHFAPLMTCNRAQTVTFLWRAAGCPTAGIETVPFIDVDEDGYYYEAMLWAYEEGITNGVDNTHFAPNGDVSRAQIVTMIYRFTGETADGDMGFVDVGEGDYFFDAVTWAVSEGITNGVDATHFAPNRTCTRGEMVTFLQRYFA